MSKSVIGLMYFLNCLAIAIGALIIFLGPLGDYNQASGILTYRETNCASQLNGSADCTNFGGDINAYNTDLQYYKDLMAGDLQRMLIVAIVASLVGGLFGMIGWIGMQINLAKAQLWTWFALNFLFGSVSWVVYLVVGPGSPRSSASSQSLPAAQPAASSIPPQPLSALGILQQRFARGEIDAATYQQMRDQLTV